MIARAVAAVLLAVGLVPIPGHAVETAILAGPGSLQAGFVTKVAPAQVGGTIVFINRDLALHQVASSNIGSDDTSWCGPLDPTKPEDPISNPRKFPRGQCPLFATELTISGQSVPVLGVEHLVARPYAFHCTVHPETMQAVLVVVA